MKVRIVLITFVLLFSLGACTANSGTTGFGLPRSEHLKKSETFSTLEIEYHFYNNIELMEFIEQQPSGSVDVVHLDMTQDHYSTIVLVIVKNVPLSSRAFSTVFFTDTGHTMTRQWHCADGNTSDECRAVFVLPERAINGQTKIASAVEK